MTLVKMTIFRLVNSGRFSNKERVSDLNLKEFSVGTLMVYLFLKVFTRVYL